MALKFTDCDGLRDLFGILGKIRCFVLLFGGSWCIKILEEVYSHAPGIDFGVLKRPGLSLAAQRGLLCGSGK